MQREFEVCGVHCQGSAAVALRLVRDCEKVARLALVVRVEGVFSCLEENQTPLDRLSVIPRFLVQLDKTAERADENRGGEVVLDSHVARAEEPHPRVLVLVDPGEGVGDAPTDCTLLRVVILLRRFQEIRLQVVQYVFCEADCSLFGRFAPLWLLLVLHCHQVHHRERATAEHHVLHSSHRRRAERGTRGRARTNVFWHV
mmetsp:Transcript_14588/g.32613  ORF Transcript_14588/g.32613 Transcript_14588/m.32613 type:complete len:200 (+) Transcript_14588:363-962(+)